MTPLGRVSWPWNLVAESDSIPDLKYLANGPGSPKLPLDYNHSAKPGSDRGGSQSTTEKQSPKMHIRRKGYFKQLAHGTVGRRLAKSEICKGSLVGW